MAKKHSLVEVEFSLSSSTVKTACALGDSAPGRIGTSPDLHCFTGRPITSVEDSQIMIKTFIFVLLLGVKADGLILSIN